MIENEVKFVLNTNLYDSLDQYNMGHPKQIMQGYSGKNARVRATWQHKDHSEDESSYRFTYKMPLDNGEVEEIETDVPQDSFERIYIRADPILTKTRFTTEIKDETWDLDFLINPFDQTIYFCLAECEMPQGRLAPKSNPLFIQQHLIYAVPREDTSLFSSRKLADIGYAMECLEKFNA